MKINNDESIENESINTENINFYLDSNIYLFNHILENNEIFKSDEIKTLLLFLYIELLNWKSLEKIYEKYIYKIYSSEEIQKLFKINKKETELINLIFILIYLFKKWKISSWWLFNDFIKKFKKIIWKNEEKEKEENNNLIEKFIKQISIIEYINLNKYFKKLKELNKVANKLDSFESNIINNFYKLYKENKNKFKKIVDFIEITYWLFYSHLIWIIQNEEKDKKIFKEEKINNLFNNLKINKIVWININDYKILTEIEEKIYENNLETFLLNAENHLNKDIYLLQKIRLWLLNEWYLTELIKKYLLKLFEYRKFIKE